MRNPPIRFRFNARKAAEAANLLLLRSGGRRNYMDLVKLLCLADREALIRFESPITGDRVAALPHGLILSRILNLIRFGPADEEDAPWFDVISAPEGYSVRSLQIIENEELSSAEEKLLDEVFERYGKMDWRQLSRLTHSLPEWTDPGGGSIPISPEQILKLAGKQPDEIARIGSEIRAYERLDQELASYCVESKEG